MANSISQDLINFKTIVSSSISNMNTNLENLKEKISTFINASSSFKSGIDSVYSSQNKIEILNKLTKINSVLTKIDYSLDSDLSSILKKSNTLLEKIDTLEKLKQEIESQENIILNLGSAKSYSYDSNGNITNQKEIDRYNSQRSTALNEANSIISTKTSEFIILHNESIATLNELKALDSSFSFVSEFATTDISSISQYLTGGSFEKYTYKASNGVSLDYYLYVPTFSTDVTNIPVHIYLHGYGERENSVLKQGLPKLLNNGLQANGIVICPQSVDGNWENDNIQDALIELTDNVVEKYSADSNKISLSGHSAGAIGGYRLIARNPDYFSAFIPISGHANRVENKTVNAWQTLSKVKIWAFHGKNDTSVQYSYAENVVNKLESLGSNNIDLYTFDAGHGGVQNTTFEQAYSYKGEEAINPLDWAFSQSKENN